MRGVSLGPDCSMRHAVGGDVGFPLDWLGSFDGDATAAAIRNGFTDLIDLAQFVRDNTNGGPVHHRYGFQFANYPLVDEPAALASFGRKIARWHRMLHAWEPVTFVRGVPQGDCVTSRFNFLARRGRVVHVLFDPTVAEAEESGPDRYRMFREDGGDNNLKDKDRERRAWLRLRELLGLTVQG